MLYGMAAIFESFNAESRSLFEDTATLAPGGGNADTRGMADLLKKHGLVK
jgi:hypothetical protein